MSYLPHPLFSGSCRKMEQWYIFFITANVYFCDSFFEPKLSFVKKLLLVNALFAFACPTLVNAQDNASKLTLKVGGYIRTETFYDTYRSVEGRDGESYNYPMRKGFDAAGVDTNKINQFEMLGLQSRFRISSSGLTAFGAKVSSLIEADFLGMSEDYKYQVGLRHALVRLDWDKTQLMMGQYWAPMSLPEFAANTVLFASGTTFQPVARATQARVTYQLMPKMKLIGAILAHSTHKVIEPKGTNSQRNSGLPDLQAQMQYGGVSEFFFALTGGYKFLRPYITTNVGGKRETSEIVGSYNLQACLGYQFSKLSTKFQANLGQNLTNYGMIGGYLPVAGSLTEKGYSYANITTLSMWTDFETKGETLKFGLYAGYSRNLGTNKDVILKDGTTNFASDLCRGANIYDLIRISPRVYVIDGAFEIGAEYIMNTARYGTFLDRKVVDLDQATINNRILLSVKYSF